MFSFWISLILSTFSIVFRKLITRMVFLFACARFAYIYSFSLVSHRVSQTYILIITKQASMIFDHKTNNPAWTQKKKTHIFVCVHFCSFVSCVSDGTDALAVSYCYSCWCCRSRQSEREILCRLFYQFYDVLSASTRQSCYQLIWNWTSRVMFDTSATAWQLQLYVQYRRASLSLFFSVDLITRSTCQCL